MSGGPAGQNGGLGMPIDIGTRQEGAVSRYTLWISRHREEKSLVQEAPDIRGAACWLRP